MSEAIMEDTPTLSDGPGTKRVGRKPRPPSHKANRTGERVRVEPSNAKHSGRDEIRTPNLTDPALLERQRRCYDLRVQSMSIVNIASVMGMERHTVARDIQVESVRRREEAEPDWETTTSLQSDAYQERIFKLTQHVNMLRKKGDEVTLDATKLSYYHAATAVDRTITGLMVAREKLLGLRAPVRVSLEDNTTIAFQNAMNTFAALDLETRKIIMASGRIGLEERKMKTVEPL